jgi:hypothetical protein
MKKHIAKQMSFDIPKGRPAVFRQRQLTDESPFPFGKHKGTKMMAVPMSYLNWFLQQEWSRSWPAVVEYVQRANRGLQQDLKREGEI